MRWKSIMLAVALTCVQTNIAFADELTQIVQQDLHTLGYDIGTADGTASTKTLIAVSKFQAEHGMEVTGEITPQLAGVIQAAISQQSNPASSTPVATAAQLTPEQAQADLRARQDACLQEKVAAAQRASNTQSGLTKLFSAVSRTASQYAGSDTIAAIHDTSNQVYSAGATVSDLQGAAADLGISESDVEACQNP